MTGQTKKTWQIVVTGILIVGIAIMALPLLFGAAYTYPSADDFIIEAGVKLRTVYDGPLKASLRSAWEYYTGWQGTFLSDFLLFTITPYSRFGLSGFRIVMVLLAASYVASLGYMCAGFAQYICGKKEKGNQESRNIGLFMWFLFLFITLGLPDTWFAKELFFWYTASMVYLVGMIASFLSFGCVFRAYETEKKGYYLAAAIWGFLASGTTLPVASYGCSWNLLLLLVTVFALGMTKETLNIWTMLPFLGTFVGALLNALSPGNFARSQSTMGELGSYSIKDAIKDSIGVWRGEVRYVLHSPIFIMVLVVGFILCIFSWLKVVRKGKNISLLGVVLVLLGCMASQYLCVFPIVYGYHNAEVAYRTTYMQRFDIYFTCLFFVMYLGQFVASRIVGILEKKKRGVSVLAAIAAMVVCFLSFAILDYNPAELTSGFSFEIVKELRTGTMQEVFAMRKEVLDTMANSAPGSDVVILMPSLPNTRVTYSQGLCADVDLLDNKSAAVLFDLNTVYVEYGVR